MIRPDVCSNVPTGNLYISLDYFSGFLINLTVYLFKFCQILPQIYRVATNRIKGLARLQFVKQYDDKRF